MALSQIGTLIKSRRIELGLTQEELSDGICSVTTLSRIENGERMPTQNHLEIILQRIGYSDMMIHTCVDKKDFLIHEMKFKIRQAYIEKDTVVAQNLFLQLESMLITSSRVDEQFKMLYRILLFSDNYSNEERLIELEKAVRLTNPKYRQGHVPYLLSYEEIILLNNIANTKAKCGFLKEAIDLLYGIINYYDKHMINMEEVLRTEPMTLYNLSKYLGLENRYNESLVICERGIVLAQKTGRSQCFAQTLYNKAWVLIKQNRSANYEEAKIIISKAYNVAIAFEDVCFAEHCRMFMKNEQML